jgi:mRNA interferase MazF
MRRGEIWTVAGGSDYAGKPRPAVIVQDDAFSGTSSITLCVFTSDPTTAPLFRLVVEPSQANGLRSVSSLLVDKLTTVPKTKLGSRIGKLDDDDLVRLNHAIIVFLGVAGSSKSRS